MGSLCRFVDTTHRLVSMKLYNDCCGVSVTFKKEKKEKKRKTGPMLVMWNNYMRSVNCMRNGSRFYGNEWETLSGNQLGEFVSKG